MTSDTVRLSSTVSAAHLRRETEHLNRMTSDTAHLRRETVHLHNHTLTRFA